jgi:hypothetical protein
MTPSQICFRSLKAGRVVNVRGGLWTAALKTRVCFPIASSCAKEAIWLKVCVLPFRRCCLFWTARIGRESAVHRFCPRFATSSFGGRARMPDAHAAMGWDSPLTDPYVNFRFWLSFSRGCITHMSRHQSWNRDRLLDGACYSYIV